MTVSPSTRLAFRNLGRNVRRTAISIGGIAIGCALALVTLAWEQGQSESYVLAAAESGAGHLRIAPDNWLPRRNTDLRLKEYKAELEMARQTEGVASATPRARTQALLAMGTRTLGIEMTGVDPTTEASTFRPVRTMAAGRYLQPDDVNAMVVGKAIAQRLDATVGDEIVATVSGADGGMKSAVLTIVGIVDTGSEEVDLSICQVNLSDVAELTDRPGAGEIAILLRNQNQVDRLAEVMAKNLAPGDTVLTWRKVVPEFDAVVQINAGMWRMTCGFVIFVVIIGVASAQLAAVLERRKEFAVLGALGMKDAAIVRLLMVEAFILGTVGAALGLMLSAPGIYYLMTVGFNMAAFGGGDITFSGVRFDPILYADAGWWLFPFAFILAWTATLLASLYPAWFAARTDPAAALRVAQ